MMSLTLKTFLRTGERIPVVTLQYVRSRAISYRPSYHINVVQCDLETPKYAGTRQLVFGAG